jgi:hypothetical protein
MTERAAMQKAMIYDLITDVVTSARRQIQYDNGDGTVEFGPDDKAVKRAVENLMRHVFETRGAV